MLFFRPKDKRRAGRAKGLAASWPTDWTNGLRGVGATFLLAAMPGVVKAQQPPLPSAPLSASISGVVNDVGGAAVPGAHLTLVRAGADKLETSSDGAGGFRFEHLAAGDFTLTIVEDGLEPAKFAISLHVGEAYTVLNIALKIAVARADVVVTVPPYEIAEAELHVEEHQRVLGIVPNFFVSYVQDAAPLTAKQKFKLSLRVTQDPTTFLAAGLEAGVEQALNTFPGYHQGAKGYGKRYGAALANDVSGTFFRAAILPSLLHQDPRYFYKGTGSTWERARYALESAVICKGDNERWQPNYSSIGGNLAAGALANAYYPASSRHGVALTFEDGLLSIAGVGVGHLVQEFVLLKITPNVHRAQP